MNEENSKLSMVFRALSFAAHKHKDQRRKDVEASPYINHPIALADILVNEGNIVDVEVICSALLHDTIEDTETKAVEIGAIFGKSVQSIVEEVTDDKSLPKQERKKLQIEHAGSASPQAKLVKLADKISNLRDMNSSPPADWPEERLDEYYKWAKEVIDQVRGVHAGLEGLFDSEFKKRQSTRSQ